MTRDVLLITGASSDIGLALVRRLALLPNPPLILAHYHSSAGRIEALCDSIGATSVYPVQADFLSEESVRDLAERVNSEFGGPRRIVHIPGLSLVYERFTKFSWEHFEMDLSVQVRSAVILLKRFLPAMAKMPSAKVVFLLSSVTRGVPPKFMSMYTMVKHTQLGLVRALASEYSGTGVCINAVSPGMVDTRFLAGVPELVKEKAAASSPKGRNASPEEVVGAIEFLLSEDANYITGVELPVAAGSVY